MSPEIFGSEMSQWAWDTMIAMTLLMAVVLVLRKPVSHFFGAKIAYLLWILPFARLFMPVLTLEVPAPMRIASPIGQNIVATEALFSERAGAVVAGASSIDWLVIVMILWLGGAGLLFLSKLGAYFQFREDIIADGQLVGRHGNIKILETAAVGGPLAFGLFRKYIAVPTHFFRNYAPMERELALEHEIAHHESGDLAANFAGLLILSLHWFNPVAWFAWIAFREDQETACDARILQKTGHETRAVYGRTIAKSASGHKLGLASPLNQKDKIKGRLKMLGREEKSSFRKRIGALMVGGSAVIALPLTATVVYAEAEVAEAHPSEDRATLQVHSAGTSVNVGDDGVLVTEKTDDGYKYTVSNKRGTYEFRSKRKLNKNEIDKKLTRMVPSYRKMSMPEAPEAPVWPKPASGSDRGDVVKITSLNGSKNSDHKAEFVHRVKHEGRTIILHTNEKLSDEDVQEMVVEAEESRLEAEAGFREHKREMKEHKMEMREQKSEMGLDMREVEREIADAVREARQEARWETRNAAQESRRSISETGRVWSIASQVAEISFSTRPIRLPKAKMPKFKTRMISNLTNCRAMGQSIAFGGQPGVNRDRAWASVAGCSEIQAKIDHKKLMKITLRSLKERRAAAVKSCDNPDAGLRRDLRNYDHEIKKLQKKLHII